MRKAKNENKQVIEIQDDVKINEDVILEKGDKIEVLGKVEENNLKESHLDYIKEKFADGLMDAYTEENAIYALEEIFDLVQYAGFIAEKSGAEDFAEKLSRLNTTIGNFVNKEVY